VVFVFSFENMAGGGLYRFEQTLSIASFQHGALGSRVDMDVSGRIPRTWMPAIHAGMTEIRISPSAAERKLMNHFVAKFLTGSRAFPRA
jgi:hypothetical protein